jgi:hypothetical protein
LLKAAADAVKTVGMGLSAACLRPKSEIKKAREAAELWFWRARTTLFQKAPDESRGGTETPLDQIVESVALRAEQDGIFRTIDKDFPRSARPTATWPTGSGTPCAALPGSGCTP